MKVLMATGVMSDAEARDESFNGYGRYERRRGKAKNRRNGAQFTISK
jgi:hypothetical protein